MSAPAANRLDYQSFSFGQLKIITMIIFAGFAYWYMEKPPSWNYLYAGLCMVGAACFITVSAASSTCKS